MDRKTTCKFEVVFSYEGSDAQTILRISQLIKGKYHVFDPMQIIPIPEGENDSNWKYENWGCDIGIRRSDIWVFNKNIFVIKGETYTRPPIFALFKIMEMYPDVYVSMSSYNESLGLVHLIIREANQAIIVTRGVILPNKPHNCDVIAIYKISDFTRSRDMYLYPVRNGLDVIYMQGSGPRTSDSVGGTSHCLVGWPREIPCPENSDFTLSERRERCAEGVKLPTQNGLLKIFCKSTAHPHDM